MGNNICYYCPEDYKATNCHEQLAAPVIRTLYEDDELNRIVESLFNRQKFIVKIPFDLFDDSIHHWSLDSLQVDSGLTLEQTGMDTDN